MTDFQLLQNSRQTPLLCVLRCGLCLELASTKSRRAVSRQSRPHPQTLALSLRAHRQRAQSHTASSQWPWRAHRRPARPAGGILPAQRRPQALSAQARLSRGRASRRSQTSSRTRLSVRTHSRLAGIVALTRANHPSVSSTLSRDRANRLQDQDEPRDRAPRCHRHVPEGPRPRQALRRPPTSLHRHPQDGQASSRVDFGRARELRREEGIGGGAGT